MNASQSAAAIPADKPEWLRMRLLLWPLARRRFFR
jgi:hypothetical protein